MSPAVPAVLMTSLKKTDASHVKTEQINSSQFDGALIKRAPHGRPALIVTIASFYFTIISLYLTIISI